MPKQTLTVSINDLNSMINVQRNLEAQLVNNNTNKESVQLSFASVASGILGLVFWKARLAVTISLGIISVLTGAGSMTRGDLIERVEDGEKFLMRTFVTMTNLGAVSANITVNYSVFSLEHATYVLDSGDTNYMTAADGTIIGRA